MQHIVRQYWIMPINTTLYVCMKTRRVFEISYFIAYYVTFFVYDLFCSGVVGWCCWCCRLGWLWWFVLLWLVGDVGFDLVIDAGEGGALDTDVFGVSHFESVVEFFRAGIFSLTRSRLLASSKVLINAIGFCASRRGTPLLEPSKIPVGSMPFGVKPFNWSTKYCV